MLLKQRRFREALNKPILDFSEHAKQKAWFLLCFIFNGLQPSKMAAHPCAAGTSDLIRGSLGREPDHRSPPASRETAAGGDRRALSRRNTRGAPLPQQAYNSGIQVLALMTDHHSTLSRFKVAAAAVVVLVVVALAAYLRHPMESARTRLPAAVPGLLWPAAKTLHGIALTDHRNQPFDDEKLKGKWSLLFFGYTHCPDVCPNTLQMLNQVVPKLPADTQVVFVSVDPQRDTPERLAEYISYFHPDFLGVGGSREAVNALTAQIGVVNIRNAESDTGQYTVDHTVSLFLVDPELRLVGLFSPPLAAGALERRYRQVRELVEREG
ncbi:MAG: SCO family protein [Chromatiales bacterium]